MAWTGLPLLVSSKDANLRFALYTTAKDSRITSYEAWYMAQDSQIKALCGHVDIGSSRSDGTFVPVGIPWSPG